MASHQADIAATEYYFYRFKYSRRRIRRIITEDRLPPPPPPTPEIISHKPEILDDETEDDMEEEEKEKAYVEVDEDKYNDEDEEEQDGDAKCVCAKRSRSEKKSRKAVLKLGMQPVSGVHKVTVKKNKNSVFVVSNPEVFKNPISESYVIFGKAMIEENNSQQQTEEQLKAPNLSHAISEPGSSGVVKEDEGIDELGMDPRDIELVMTQTGLSRANAAKALKAADNDIVTAIMENMKK